MPIKAGNEAFRIKPFLKLLEALKYLGRRSLWGVDLRDAPIARSHITMETC